MAISAGSFALTACDQRGLPMPFRPIWLQVGNAQRRLRAYVIVFWRQSRRSATRSASKMRQNRCRLPRRIIPSVPLYWSMGQERNAGHVRIEMKPIKSLSKKSRESDSTSKHRSTFHYMPFSCILISTLCQSTSGRRPSMPQRRSDQRRIIDGGWILGQIVSSCSVHHLPSL